MKDVLAAHNQTIVDQFGKQAASFARLPGHEDATRLLIEMAEIAPDYMQVTRAGCTLHLTEHHGDCCPGTTVFVWMMGLDEFHQEITAKGYGYLRPGVEQTFYEAKCMEVIDPFGNRIRFNENVK